MANFRKNLLKKTVAKSTSEEVQKLLGQQAVVAKEEPKYHPQMKLSKRMKKKLEKTGRTSTKEKITKGAELEAKIAKIKATPRPKLPKAPKVPTLPQTPPSKPKAKEDAIHQAEDFLRNETLEQEMKRKQYITDMLLTNNPYLTQEEKDKIAEALYNASQDTMDEIYDIFADDQQWYYFYSSHDEAEANYMSETEKAALIDDVMDILGLD